MSQRGSHRNDL